MPKQPTRQNWVGLRPHLRKRMRMIFFVRVKQQKNPYLHVIGVSDSDGTHNKW